MYAGGTDPFGSTRSGLARQFGLAAPKNFDSGFGLPDASLATVHTVRRFEWMLLDSTYS